MDTEPAIDQRQRRILVAEDDPATLALLRRQLERAGYTVIACADGKEALAALTNEGPEIVVADWLMPEMTGIELCRAVAELRASQVVRSLHFILLTAHGDKEKVVEGLEAGADDFLKKPYDLQELLARIRAGERILTLQNELYERQLELGKSNAELAVLNSKLTRLANYDSLTELPNRRYTIERFREAWDLARRHGRQLSCIMLDIDHFKRVNDTYGHHSGDLVLQEVARRIRDACRRYDFCGRFGGEEFLVVNAEEGITGATALAERIRTAVEGKEIAVEQNSVRVTISLGAASMRPEQSELDALIGEADGALYAAKGHGRNQVWYVDASGAQQHYTPTPVVGKV
ncbi:MAG: diguanylate cyclase [Phycisphaerae bacterium]|jgi:diguanylate cyclase (GGDEF)-like protein